MSHFGTSFLQDNKNTAAHFHIVQWQLWSVIIVNTYITVRLPVTCVCVCVFFIRHWGVLYLPLTGSHNERLVLPRHRGGRHLLWLCYQKRGAEQPVRPGQRCVWSTQCEGDFIFRYYTTTLELSYTVSEMMFYVWAAALRMNSRILWLLRSGLIWQQEEVSYH